MEHAAGRGLKSSWPWLEFAAGLPAKAVPFPVKSAGFQAFGGRCIYLGITGANAATVAGSIILYDGQDATGAQVGNYAAAASSPVSQLGPSNGVMCEIGLWVVPTGITLTGSVLVIPLWHYSFTPPGE